MPTESCLHSAANADGCCYQRQRIVGLLRNACEAGTMLRRKDAIISVLCISQCTIYHTICAHAKGCCNLSKFPLSRYPTLSSQCLICVLCPQPPFLATWILREGVGSKGRKGGGGGVSEEQSNLEDL